MVVWGDHNEDRYAHPPPGKTTDPGLTNTTHPPTTHSCLSRALIHRGSRSLRVRAVSTGRSIRFYFTKTASGATTIRHRHASSISHAQQHRRAVCGEQYRVTTPCRHQSRTLVNRHYYADAPSQFGALATEPCTVQL